MINFHYHGIAEQAITDHGYEWVKHSLSKEIPDHMDFSPTIVYKFLYTVHTSSFCNNCMPRKGDP